MFTGGKKMDDVNVGATLDAETVVAVVIPPGSRERVGD